MPIFFCAAQSLAANLTARMVVTNGRIVRMNRLDPLGRQQFPRDHQEVIALGASIVVARLHPNWTNDAAATGPSQVFRLNHVHESHYHEGRRRWVADVGRSGLDCIGQWSETAGDIQSFQVRQNFMRTRKVPLPSTLGLRLCRFHCGRSHRDDFCQCRPRGVSPGEAGTLSAIPFWKQVEPHPAGRSFRPSTAASRSA